MKNIEQFSQELHKLIDSNLPLSQLIELVGHNLAEFTKDTRWFQDFVEARLFDGEFFLSQMNSIWQNEVTLLRSPDREYSLLLYIWEPHTIDIIHDHGSWGVLTPLFNPFCERKYQRIDDGCKEGYAELKEISYKAINRGTFSHVLPLENGIHRIENPTDNYVISLNVYGHPLRHGYVQFFNALQRKVWRAYPPRTHKQITMIQAMSHVSEPWVERLLASALNRDLPDYVKDQCQRSMKQPGK